MKSLKEIVLNKPETIQFTKEPVSLENETNSTRLEEFYTPKGLKNKIKYNLNIIGEELITGMQCTIPLIVAPACLISGMIYAKGISDYANRNGIAKTQVIKDILKDPKYMVEDILGQLKNPNPEENYNNKQE